MNALRKHQDVRRFAPIKLAASNALVQQDIILALI